MKILSIDWDYFFTDSFPYDWGHKENGFFLEAIWPMRLNNHNQATGVPAFEEYKPTIPKDFWKRVVKGSSLMFVAESHASILALPFRKAIITNLDAHHDCGYNDNPELECGNWAKDKDRIKEYHLCYPAWRLDNGEGYTSQGREPDSVRFDLPALADYDLVFVCRSGCWTPPWYDMKFRSFLKQSGFQTDFLDQYAGRNRSPNMNQAKVLKVQMDEQFKSLLNRKVA
jgi:hypothetical protein